MVFKQFIFHIISIILLAILIWFLVRVLDLYPIKDTDRQTIITAFVTASIFILGLITQSIGNKWMQVQKDRLLRKVILYNLKTIIEGLRLQIEDGKHVINMLQSKQAENVKISTFTELE